MKLTFRDPIGPGTPAWKQFDKALAAYRSRRFKKYFNHRDYMIRLLRRDAPASIPQWIEALNTQCALDPMFD